MQPPVKPHLCMTDPSPPVHPPHQAHPAATAGRWARLRLRFDSALLTEPPGTGTPKVTPACVDGQALQRCLTALCAGGAGLATAHHRLAADVALRAQQKAWLDHQLLALDGTWHMQSLGGPWRQRVHRLGLKWREFMATGAAPVGPWDCGYLNTGADAAAHATAFVPRRPTLIVAWQLPAAALAPLQVALQARSCAYSLPVRLWVLDAPLPP